MNSSDPLKAAEENWMTSFSSISSGTGTTQDFTNV
jgi:hypothetical protein